MLLGEEQLQVFDILRQRQAFMGHALLYESWATVLEMQGNLKRAMAVYEDGIARQAQPLARLERHFQ